MFTVIKYTLPSMLRGNIQTVVLNNLLSSLFGPIYSQQPELIIVTSREIINLDSRIKQVVIPVKQPGHLDLYKRISIGLEHSSFDTIFLAEQDVLYPKGFFQDGLATVLKLDQNQVSYNMNVLTANSHGFFKGKPEYLLLSNLVGTKRVLKRSIERRLDFIYSGGDIVWSEPGISWDGFNDSCVTTKHNTKYPSIDIRYGNNFTGTRESKIYRPYSLYWGMHKKIWKQLDL